MRTALLLSGNHASTQHMLQHSDFRDDHVEEPFLQQFAVVAELHWNLFHPFIVPTAQAQELHTQQQKTVLNHLQTWNRKMHPTYGDLSDILSRLYIEQPVSNAQYSDEQEEPSKCMLSTSCPCISNLACICS